MVQEHIPYFQRSNMEMAWSELTSGKILVCHANRVTVCNSMAIGWQTKMVKEWDEQYYTIINVWDKRLYDQIIIQYGFTIELPPKNIASPPKNSSHELCCINSSLRKNHHCTLNTR